MQRGSASVLCAGWSGGDDRMLAAVIGHALDFSTWQSLAERRGLTDAEATEAMAVLVQGVVSGSAAAGRGSTAG